MNASSSQIGKQTSSRAINMMQVQKTNLKVDKMDESDESGFRIRYMRYCQLPAIFNLTLLSITNPRISLHTIA